MYCEARTAFNWWLLHASLDQNWPLQIFIIRINFSVQTWRFIQLTIMWTWRLVSISIWWSLQSKLKSTEHASLTSLHSAHPAATRLALPLYIALRMLCLWASFLLLWLVARILWPLRFSLCHPLLSILCANRTLTMPRGRRSSGLEPERTPPGATFTPGSLHSKPVAVLHPLFHQRHLPATGRKPDLNARLLDSQARRSDVTPQPPPDPAPPATLISSPANTLHNVPTVGGANNVHQTSSPACYGKFFRSGLVFFFDQRGSQLYNALAKKLGSYHTSFNHQRSTKRLSQMQNV